MLSRLSSLPLKILSRSDDDGVVVQPMSPFAYEDKAADDDSYVIGGSKRQLKLPT